MSKIKVFTFIITFLFQFNCFSADVFDEAISALDRGLDKKSDVVWITALNRSLDLYKSNKNDKYLSRILNRFDRILKYKDAYFIVENFLGVYVQDKKKFEEILTKSLSKEDKEKFMMHMKAIVREMEHGNG